ncbi:MAG: hypothetical protein ACK6DY_02790, partial [Acidobacteriota bacterium]
FKGRKGGVTINSTRAAPAGAEQRIANGQPRLPGKRVAAEQPMLTVSPLLAEAEGAHGYAKAAGVAVQGPERRGDDKLDARRPGGRRAADSKRSATPAG